MLCLILSLAEKICKVFMVALALVGTKDYNKKHIKHIGRRIFHEKNINAGYNGYDVGC